MPVVIHPKEVEKITSYQDLRIEVEQLWERKAIVVPVVIHQKEVEKIMNYQDLRIEVEQLLERKAIVVPVVLLEVFWNSSQGSALRAIPKTCRFF